jgi:hypothetical protein
MCRARVPSAMCQWHIKLSEKARGKASEQVGEKMKIIVVVDGVVPVARLVIGCPQTKDGWGGWTVEQLKKVETHTSSGSQSFTCFFRSIA